MAAAFPWAICTQTSCSLRWNEACRLYFSGSRFSSFTRAHSGALCELPDLASGWMERGILVGALGGLVGFFTSGVVHYNWGDSEVVMVLYMIMGLALVIHRELHRPAAN